MIRNNTSNKFHMRIWGLIIFCVSFLLYAIIHVNINKEPVVKTADEIRCEQTDICAKEYYVYSVKETFNTRINQRVISMYISSFSDIDYDEYSKPNTVLDLSVNDEDANKIMYRINQAMILNKQISLLTKYNGGHKYTLYGLSEDLKNIVVPETAKLKLETK